MMVNPQQISKHVKSYAELVVVASKCVDIPSFTERKEVNLTEIISEVVKPG